MQTILWNRYKFDNTRDHWGHIHNKPPGRNTSSLFLLLLPCTECTHHWVLYSSVTVKIKAPQGNSYSQKTGGDFIYTVRNWAGAKLSSVSLNSSTELAVVAADGRLFHSRMGLGKKEFRWTSFLVDGIRKVFWPLVLESDGRRYTSAGIATRLCWVLNSKRRRILTLLTWSGSHPSWVTIWVTLPGCLAVCLCNYWW